MCDIVLEDIGGESCEPVAGLSQVMYIAPHKDFDALFDPPELDAVGNLATKATIAGPHTFLTGKGFTKITLVTESGGLTSSRMGEKKRGLFQNTLTGQIAGSDAEILGFLRVAKNLDCVVLVEEFGTGKLRQIGSKRYPASFVNIEAVIEAVAEGNNSVTITVQDKQRWPAPIYTGTVTMMPETP